jgi:hypothetical protein
MELMNVTKHHLEKTAVTLAAKWAFEPLVNLIHEGQHKRIIQWLPYEDIGIVLYATINGLAALVNNGFVDVERLEELTSAAVGQFLRGTAP